MTAWELMRELRQGLRRGDIDDADVVIDHDAGTMLSPVSVEFVNGTLCIYTEVVE